MAEEKIIESQTEETVQTNEEGGQTIMRKITNGLVKGAKTVVGFVKKHKVATTVVAGVTAKVIYDKFIKPEDEPVVEETDFSEEPAEEVEVETEDYPVEEEPAEEVEVEETKVEA